MRRGHDVPSFSLQARKRGLVVFSIVILVLSFSVSSVSAFSFSNSISEVGDFFSNIFGKLTGTGNVVDSNGNDIQLLQLSIDACDADFDGDMIVGDADFALFSAEYGNVVTSNNSQYDLNGEGETIDFDDYVLFAQNYGKECDTSGSSDTSGSASTELPTGDVTHEVSEGSTATVTCPSGSSITDIEAYYYCPDDSQGRGKYCDVSSLVGGQSASFRFTNVNCGGDPCQYVLKKGILATSCSSEVVESDGPGFLITLDTEKDVYRVGEQVKLTSGRESEEFSEIIGTTNSIIENGFFSSVSLKESATRNSSDFDRILLDFAEPSYEGYIVEFEGKAIIEKRVDLETRAKKNEESFWNKVPGVNRLYKAITFLPGDIHLEVEKYASDLSKSNEIIKGEIFATLNRASLSKSTTASERISPESGGILEEFDLVFNGIALNISDEDAEIVRNLKGVKNVEPNLQLRLFLQKSVPSIGADRVWDLNRNSDNCFESDEDCLTGRGIKIAIIDSGVDYTHPDFGSCTAEEFLSENCEKVVGGYDFGEGDLDPMDNLGHGTHVAATAAGNGVLKGVAPGAQILAYKVSDSSGRLSMNYVLSALERAVEDDADIISMSLGIDCSWFGDSSLCGSDDFVSRATDNVVLSGTTVVVAAGNSGEGRDTIGSPGTARRAITVGASDNQGNIAGFSSRGPVIWIDKSGSRLMVAKPDISAPGVGICAAQWRDWAENRQCLDEDHIAIQGTSMATPHVSGAAALLLQKNPDWTPEEVKSNLMEFSRNLGKSVLSQGQGVINVFDSVLSDERPCVLEIDSLDNPYSPGISFSGSAYCTGELEITHTLSYLDSEGSFNEIYSSQIPVSDSFLYNFDSSDLDDGEYVIKLEATRNLGSTSQLFTRYSVIAVDNFNFKIGDSKNYISLDRYSEGIDISGSLDLSDYNYYVLEYKKSDESSWKEACREEGVRNGVLCKMNSDLLGEGFYDFRMSALRGDHEVFSEVIKVFVSQKLFAGGEGTKENPFQISTCIHLQNMKYEVDSHHVLTGDIDCSDTKNWNNGEGFEPIGGFCQLSSAEDFGGYTNCIQEMISEFGSLKGFEGTLDGKGFTIKNLHINRPFGLHVGLFGLLGAERGESEVHNLLIEEAEITGLSMTGGLGGVNYGLVLSVGVENLKGRALDGIAGGIFGGGYSGYIAGSYSTGIISGEEAGGILGSLTGHPGKTPLIRNSYSAAEVSGKIYSGGLVGSAFYGGIEDSYFAGVVSGLEDDSRVGNVVGGYNSVLFSDNYFLSRDKTFTGCSWSTGSFSGCTSIAENLHPPYFFNINNPPMDKWDFKTGWSNENDGIDYPSLKRSTSNPEDFEEDQTPEKNSSSEIVNNKDSNLTGLLIMNLQTKVGGVDWVDFSPPSLSGSIRVEVNIGAFDSLDLSEIWNSRDIDIPFSGVYRARVALLDENYNVKVDGGKSLESFSNEFQVVN